MGEFYAWAATGIVTGLQIWPDPNAASQKPEGADMQPLVHRQRFLLRQRDGRDIEILLVDSGISFRNGHAITAVWAAREKAPFGHCIYLENHTTGAIARLKDSLKLIRRQAKWWKIVLSGFLATFPAMVALIGWLMMQRGPGQTDVRTFLISASIAAVLLFIIGVVTSKLVFDYLRAEDERKIWLAADRALYHARRLLLDRPRLPRVM